MTTRTATEQAEALDYLRTILNPGDTVRTIVRHATSSGMTRWIDCYIIRNNDLEYLSWWVGHAVGSPVNSRNHDGVERGGCGMDMGFDLTYSLSRRLYPNGFDCTGPDCPSNDHSNGDHNHQPHNHTDGGYALRHRWI